jgi:hypothetical protein
MTAGRKHGQYIQPETAQVTSNVDATAARCTMKYLAARFAVVVKLFSAGKQINGRAHGQRRNSRHINKPFRRSHKNLMRGNPLKHDSSSH